jgi:hypothetical protein
MILVSLFLLIFLATATAKKPKDPGCTVTNAFCCQETYQCNHTLITTFASALKIPTKIYKTLGDKENVKNGAMCGVFCTGKLPFFLKSELGLF